MPERPQEVAMDLHVEGPEGNQTTYLVNAEGKLAYYFFPHGAIDYELVDNWPEPTRSWLRLWEPVLVDMEGPIHVPEALQGEKLSGVAREGEGAFQVNWGGNETQVGGGPRAFWRLYTYRFDMPLDRYSIRGGRMPPGMVRSIWEPAVVSEGAPKPSDANRLSSQGGPVGDSVTGGP